MKQQFLASRQQQDSKGKLLLEVYFELNTLCEKLLRKWDIKTAAAERKHEYYRHKTVAAEAKLSNCCQVILIMTRNLSSAAVT